MVLLMPAGAALAEFAEPIVVTLFSPDYVAAVPIFQIYLLVLLREIFDFGVALRALNRNAPIVHANLLAIALNIGLLTIAIPLWGLPGAALAFVVSRFAEGLYMAVRVMRAYKVGLGALAHWSELGRVAIAGIAAAGVFYGSFWLDHFGLAGIIAGGVVYTVVFLLMLLAFRLPLLTVFMRRSVKSLAA
jgi:O-antigen/teichoic acid export membrane protein